MKLTWMGLWLMLFTAPRIFGAEPQWLTEARGREGKLKEVREIHSADGWFSAKLPVAVPGKIEKKEGSYSIEFSVGSEITASCEIYPEPRDPAAFLRALAKKTFAGVIEKSQGKVEQSAIEVVDAGQFGTTPFLALRWLYHINDGKESRVGAMKQYVANKQEHSIYCAHIDLGYVHTFESVVSALIASLEFHDRTPVHKPFYRELSVAKMKGLTVGYTVLTLERDADGDVKAAGSSAVLIPVTPNTVGSLDTFLLEWTQADGTMINAAHIVSVNDVLEADLKLNPEKGRWHVEGEFKSKKINEIIQSPGLPGSWLSQALQRRVLLRAGAPREATTVVWLSADPIHFTESRISFLERIPKSGEARFRESTAGMDEDMTVDAATGQILKDVLPLGNQVLTLERLDAQGTY